MSAITELQEHVERRKSAEKAPLGWLTRDALAKEIGVSFNTLQKYAVRHLVEHPEWECDYLDATERPNSHLAPELCDLLRSELQDYVERRKSAEKAPPGWLTRRALAKEIRVDHNILKKYAAQHLVEHPEWERDYLDATGRLNFHLAPELCDLLRSELQEYAERRKSAEKAPLGWLTRGALAKEIGIKHDTLEKYIAQHLVEHPEWECDYLDAIGHLNPHLAPELCDLLRSELQEHAERRKPRDKK
ncbi:hypothetical protein HY621_00785 [Candidatus Uhrbacteria bacterium]|nr:hypothetical protein [Candidatus Uhrbacteria bacterium]